MRCPKCGGKVTIKNVGIISHYLVKPDKVILAKKEALCPVCGYVLKYKRLAEGVGI